MTLLKISKTQALKINPKTPKKIKNENKNNVKRPERKKVQKTNYS